MKLVALVCFAAIAWSQQPVAQAPMFRHELRAPFDDAAEKALSLANKIPAQKSSWRPGTGVRSIGEVFMHIAGGNHLLLTFASGKPVSREDLMKAIQAGETGEKTVTDKAKIIAELKRSIEDVRAALDRVTLEDLDQPVKLFGRDNSVRGVFAVIVSHISEHLGQSIAYARMNAIVPPWSERSGG